MKLIIMAEDYTNGISGNGSKCVVARALRREFGIDFFVAPSGIYLNGSDIFADDARLVEPPDSLSQIMTDFDLGSPKRHLGPVEVPFRNEPHPLAA